MFLDSDLLRNELYSVYFSIAERLSVWSRDLDGLYLDSGFDNHQLCDLIPEMCLRLILLNSKVGTDTGSHLQVLKELKNDACSTQNNS